MLKEAAIPADLLARAKEFTDTAVIVIGRYSGEGWDRKNDGTDDYFNLSETESDMVKAVTANFAHVAVLLNTGAIIDTSWFADNDKIASAVMIWQGGMEGGLSAADILTGEVNPSGRLADTCVKSFDDYPSSAVFHESDSYVKYSEDIFVGYRYFETIPGKKDCVVYPFLECKSAKRADFVCNYKLAKKPEEEYKLAASWNTELMEAIGRAGALEMILWLE
ncbi:MAG: glycoside hydrolase family 3 C-terminal domain-containing protein [Lachnospira sp.]|nr:glycoside hydrolase family 3 C-terminal domain-containing protein [Lachnospira sp.]